jgi:hypothetical protein
VNHEAVTVKVSLYLQISWEKPTFVEFQKKPIKTLTDTAQTLPAPLSPLMIHDWLVLPSAPLLLSLSFWNAASDIANMCGSTLLSFCPVYSSTCSCNIPIM